MQRRAATTLHLALSAVGAILYFLFVLPRWWVLTGDIPNTLATVGRIAAGVPIALAAVPVVLNLRESLKTDGGTPELALRLRAWSGVLHVLAGVLIVLTAIVEIWVGLDTAGPWLFAVYGAAAAIAVLGIAGFYLSRVAEKPPAAPKPPKASKPPREKSEKKAAWRLGKRSGMTGEADAADESPSGAPTEAPAEATNEVVASSEAAAADSDAIEVDTSIADTPIAEAETRAADTGVAEAALDAADTGVAESDDAPEPPAGGLRNKRPTGKSRHRLPR